VGYGEDVSEKKASRLTTEQNEERQAARSAKRERAKDARLVAQLAVQIWCTRGTGSERAGAVALAREFLRLAREA